MQPILPYTQEAAQVRQLGNGMRILMEPLPYLRTVTAGVWAVVGSANEQPRQAGVSHFLEHLFFKGTLTRSAHDLMAAIERRGGHLNAFTSRDYTCLYLKALDAHVGSAIEILADIVKNSQFFDLEKERNVILEEIASIDDVPEEYIHDAYASRHWPGHPLGHPVAGWLDTVSGLSLDDVRGYYGQWYKPENLLVSVVGNFDPDEVFAQLAEHFEDLPAAPTPERYGPPKAAPGFEYLERDIAQDHLCFGFPGARASDPRRYVYELLSSVLGGGSTSRLFEKVREDAGLAYAIYTFTSSYFTSGTLGVYAAVAPENLVRALELCVGELRDLRDNPLDEEELALSREQIKVGVLMALESTSNRMSRLAKSMIYHGRIVPVDEIIAAVDAVTAEDVQSLAQELFRTELCTTVVLGPPEGHRLEELAV
jgi:predicted Zn-dependent peptidase